jgi:hypothetical protein
MWNMLQRWRYRDVLQELARNDGACLYWQMTDYPRRGKRAWQAGIVRMEDDLLVHPDAITIEYGMAYTLKP